MTMKTNNSYKVEVIADNSGKWCSNGIRYATEAEALAAGNSLQDRWMAVREMRVVPSEDPINFKNPVQMLNDAAVRTLDLGR